MPNNKNIIVNESKSELILGIVKASFVVIAGVAQIIACAIGIHLNKLSDNRESNVVDAEEVTDD